MQSPRRRKVALHAKRRSGLRHWDPEPPILGSNLPKVGQIWDKVSPLLPSSPPLAFLCGSQDGSEGVGTGSKVSLAACPQE